MNKHFSSIRLRISNLPSGSNGKDDLWLRLDEEVSSSLGLSVRIDDSSGSSLVLLVVLFSVGYEHLSLLSSLLFLLISFSLEVLQQFGVSCLLLLHVFGNNSTEFKHSRYIPCHADCLIYKIINTLPPPH
jgi:hypothetical protein